MITVCCLSLCCWAVRCTSPHPASSSCHPAILLLLLLQPANFGGPLVNRDIKLTDTCHRVLPSGRELFSVIDHGGICWASGSKWSCLIDPR